MQKRRKGGKGKSRKSEHVVLLIFVSSRRMGWDGVGREERKGGFFRFLKFYLAFYNRSTTGFSFIRKFCLGFLLSLVDSQHLFSADVGVFSFSHCDLEVYMSLLSLVVREERRLFYGFGCR